MERVGALLESLDPTSTLRVRLAEARALSQWPDLVGPHLAKKTRPLRVVDGRLFVVAHGAALRQELVFHRTTLIRRFNEVCGIRRVRQIIFLESDANLSSLFEREEAEPKPSEVAWGPTAETATEEDEGPTESNVPAYRPFDAAAYRQRMERLARTEHASPRATPGGASGSPRRKE